MIREAARRDFEATFAKARAARLANCVHQADTTDNGDRPPRVREKPSSDDTGQTRTPDNTDPTVLSR